MINIRRALVGLTGTVALLAATGCSNPTINGFSISSSATSITVAPGGTATLNIASASKTTTPITAALIFYSLPTGVSTVPSAPTVTSGSQTTIQFSAAPGAPAATTNVQIVGYFGLASSTIYVSLTVAPAS